MTIETDIELLPLDSEQGDWSDLTENNKIVCQPRLNKIPSAEWQALLRQAAFQSLWGAPYVNTSRQRVQFVIDRPHDGERALKAVKKSVEWANQEAAKLNKLETDKERERLERVKVLAAQREVALPMFEELKARMQGK